jgi:endogenous inhibitor of DNA gyrase (YacG/DUF329 family)
MDTIIVNCSECGHPVSTGIVTDQQTFNAMPNVRCALTCPECGAVQIWTAADAWLDNHGASPDDLATAMLSAS